MQRKVILNPQITMPISEEIHTVIEACGYHLTTQELLHLEYEKDGKHRLLFNTYTGVIYSQYWDDKEDDRGPHWTVMFECRFKFQVDPIALLDVLNSVGAINYFELPEARTVIREIFDTIRTRPTPTVRPLSPLQLRSAIAS